MAIEDLLDTNQRAVPLLFFFGWLDRKRIYAKNVNADSSFFSFLGVF